VVGSPVAGVGRFVGRDPQLREVEAACGAATQGRGSLVVVSGEAGVGKTRFCEELADRVGQAGLAVVTARCWVDGGAPPLWPWQPLLAELCGAEAAELLAEDAGQPTVDRDRFARFAAVTERLAATCASTPGCVVIDDLHAVDVGTLLLTRFVARSLHRLRLVVVLTRRSGEPAAATPEARLLAEIESEATPLVLGRFDLVETTSFLAVHGFEDLDPELVMALHRVTSGHPLFLRRVTALGPAVRPNSLAGGLRVAIDQALGSLSPGTQRILRTSSVLGLRPWVGEAAAVNQCDAGAVLDAVDEATTAGLVAPDGPDRFGFSHELVRSTLGDGLAAADRLDAHARAVAAVAGDGPVIGPVRLARRAHHALGAAPRSVADARLAVDACLEAALAMVRNFAYEQADTLLSAAVELHEPYAIGPPSGELLVEWAQAALYCGRMTEARQRFDRAATTAQREGDPATLAQAALGLGGHWLNDHRAPVEQARVLGLQRTALESLPDRDVGLRCRLRARLAAEAVFDGGPVEQLHEVIEAARRCGDRGALAETLSLSHTALFTPVHARARLEVADELIRVAAEGGHGVLGLMGMCWRAIDLFQLGDPGAIRALEELRQRANALACQNVLHLVSVMDVMLLIRQGRLDAAEAAAGRSYALGEAAGEIDTLAFLACHTLVIRWLQGRDAELVDWADQLAASLPRTRTDILFDACAATLAARAGRRESARASLDRLAAGGLGALPQSNGWLPGMLVIVELAADLGDGALTREAYDLLVPYADLPVVVSPGLVCLGSTERGLGVAARSFGDLDRAVDHLERAVVANVGLENRPLWTMARADLAAVLRQRDGRGDRARAADLLRAAVADADSMGMTARAAAWWAELSDLDAGHDHATGDGPRARHGVIRRHEAYWIMGLGEHTIHVPDLVGMHYLAELLTHPGESIPALSLASHGAMANGPIRHELLDEVAKTAYTHRARELRHELAEAEADNDLGRAELLRAELGALIDQIEAATAPHGRSRVFVDEAERARTAVHKAIKRAIDTIERAAPDLAELLRSSIATGTRCCYTPDPRHMVTWSARQPADRTVR
jgi:tetratricopeptide (TPR) repeat protein